MPRTTSEITRLEAMARSLVDRKRKNAIRICLNQVRSVRVPGKRQVWEDWHYQLTKPDPQYSEMELLNLIMDGFVNQHHFDLIKKGFKQRMEDLEYEYHKSRLNYLLLDHVEKLKETVEQKPSQKKERSLPVKKRSRSSKRR